MRNLYDYLVVATAEADNFEWFDPRFLQTLAARATRVTVGVDKTTLDVTWLR